MHTYKPRGQTLASFTLVLPWMQCSFAYVYSIYHCIFGYTQRLNRRMSAWKAAHVGKQNFVYSFEMSIMKRRRTASHIFACDAVGKRIRVHACTPRTCGFWNSTDLLHSGCASIIYSWLTLSRLECLVNLEKWTKFSHSSVITIKSFSDYVIRPSVNSFV